MQALSGDVFVVSPHLDDAVLSLGASIAWASRSALRVTVLTVFAGDPKSRAHAGGWDRRAGFATEGEAAMARRLEDQEACRVLGAQASWLSFSEADYVGIRDEEEVWSAVSGAVADASAVLVPGFPLTNPDHAWLSKLLIERGLPGRQIGLYAEQPYRHWVRGERARLEPPAFLLRSRADVSRWTRRAGNVLHLRTKRRAILTYRSQLPLLGLAQDGCKRLNRMLLHETLRRGEAIMWLPGR